MVHVDPPISLQNLKNNIQAYDVLEEDQIKAATSAKLSRRLELCL
jgi:hypothetical protein